MGDYDNATADNTNFYRTWGDNRLLLGGHANQPDVRFATIPKAGPGPIPFAQSQSLISESCIPNNNAIDPGEVVTVSLSVTNLGTAATTNAVGTLLSGGGVKFPSGPVNYGVIPPGGTVSRSYTFTAMDPDLFCGGTVQARLQLQDGATNLGTLTYRFTTGTTTTQTFSNPASITINDNAAATPYPSNITVSGISNFVGVTVTLNGLSHTFPADIDIILVSPSGQAAYVMSDVGGNTPVTNLTLTFDDNAAAALGSGALSSGTFRPSNIDTTTDNMPPPAPAPPYAAAFSTFNGFTANGTWSLYVRDDAGVDVGSIANGWSLGILVPTCAPCGPTAAPASISGNIVSNDGAPLSGVTLRLTGSGGVEQTLTDSQGNYRFADVETGLLYTVTPSLANYMFAPGQRSFSLLADRSDAVFTAFPVQPNSNPLDIAEFFVRQQYLDFLGREPDQAGLDYWSSQLRSCGANLSCLNSRRIGVSAAFFVEAEFQQTGSFIFQMYKAGLGRELHYQEYVADRAQLIAGPDLNIRRQAFADAFVTRPEFIQRYQASTTAASFTDALLANIVSAGVDLSSQRTNLIARYNLGGSVNESRSLALQTATENAALGQAVYNRAFVLMEYFGYLRRDPDQGGFDFWVNVLNNRQPGNYRGMVCAFLTSVEYQRRFSPAITRSDADCAER